MALKVTHSYPKDTQSVYNMFIDQTYLEKKFAACGATNIEIMECAESGGQFVIKSQREVPSNPPGFAKKFLKATNTVVEVDIWEDTAGEVKKGRFEVDVKGAPIKLAGTMTLSPTADGSENVIEMEAKVSIPLVGGKIAAFIEEDSRSNLEKDHQFSVEYVKNM